MADSTSIPIIVQGNSFSLAIPLQIYYINGDQMDLQDYTPDPTDVVSVQLKGSRRNYTYTPTVEDNIAYIELSGNELADNYGVVVSIVKANGQRLRSFRTDQFFIVESSDDLTMDDIIEGLEENVIYLNSQAFVAGEDGRGITSIVKTSTAGLVDTYTITYSDNTTSTFDVTNGAAGEAGATIASVEKTATVGKVDTYTITMTDGNTFDFEVTNGLDGVDLGLANIVNNLTTGGATNVLSAEQGKVIGDELFAPVPNIIYTDQLTRQNCSLGPNKTWTKGQTSKPAKHIAIPVTAGWEYKLRVVISENTGAFYGFVTSAYSPPYTDLQTTPYVSGGDRAWLSVATGEMSVTAPSDAAWLVLGIIDGSAKMSTWSVIEIARPSDIDKIDADLFGDDGFIKPTYIKGWVESNLQASHTSDNKRTCVRVPVAEGDVVTISALSGASTGVFLSSENPVNGYWQCVKEDGTPATSRFSVPAGSTLSFVAPSNALFYLANGAAMDANADYTPKIAINKTPSLKERVESLESASDIEKSIKEFGAKGDGTTNDTTAIQQAFNAGGGIYFPAGTYIINDYIDVYSHTHVRMDSQAVIKRSNTSTQKCLLRTMFLATTTEYNGIEDFTIEGGVLDMNSSNSNVGACLAMLHAKDMRFEGVTFEHARNEYHLVDMGASANVKFVDCVFRNSLTNNVNAEQIQIDFAERVGHPYRQYEAGSACYDETPCKNIEICGCAFYLNGYSPAVGNHNPAAHTDIDIHDNVVYGAGKSVTTATRGAFAFADAYGGGNKTEALIHHNFVNDCRFIVTTKADAQCHIYLRDNIFKNFYSVKNSSSDAGIELLDNIELNL